MYILVGDRNVIFLDFIDDRLDGYETCQPTNISTYFFIKVTHLFEQ